MWLQDGRPLATLIGDVVGSRRSIDRGGLHAALRSAIHRVNAAAHPLAPVRITVGDEFQGIYPDVASAVAGMLWLRLELLGSVDTRYGLGWGPVQVLDKTGEVQDGPGWWTARAAIVESAHVAGRPRTRAVRARFSDDAESGGTPYADTTGAPLAGFVNASLRTLDELVSALSDLDLRLIRGTAAGLTQAQLAASEGLTQSAISQRLSRTGAWALLDALAALAPADPSS